MHDYSTKPNWRSDAEPERFCAEAEIIFAFLSGVAVMALLTWFMP